MSKRVKIIPGTKCILEGCDRLYSARGYCKKHYKNWRRDNNDKLCSINGCDDRFYAKSYCIRHYDQWYRLGYVVDKTYIDPRPLPIAIGSIFLVPLGVGGRHGFCIIEMSDLPLLALRWGGNKKGYATTIVKKRHILMHRLIMNDPPNYDVDHKDGNTFNNLRSNLRVCTKAENARNSRKPKGYDNPFKGVSLIRGKFRARIGHNGKLFHLGYYLKPEEAARAYDSKAVELFGEFARTNFPC